MCNNTKGNFAREYENITVLLVLARPPRQYGISAPSLQTSFLGETSGDVAKCQLFSQAAVSWVLDT